MEFYSHTALRPCGLWRSNAAVSQRDSPLFFDTSLLPEGSKSRQSAPAPSVLDSAFDILATHDVVVGPTRDGGYYLVGAKAAHPLFEGDGMGTRSALDRLLTRAKVLELSIGYTEAFYDIDGRKRFDSASSGTLPRSQEGAANRGLVQRVETGSRATSLLRGL